MVAKLDRHVWSAGLPMATKAQLDHLRRLEAASGYLDLEMPAHALRALAGIADPEVTPFEFYFLRGQALRAAGNFEEALVDLSRAREERVDDLRVLMGMAWCYKRTDRLPRAISVMEEAYRAHPKVPVVLYNIACYYSLAGDKTQALSWLGRALRMEKSLRKLAGDESEFGPPTLRKQIADEPDFDPLRNDPDFQYLTNLELLTDL
jgi:tetratricopeptide (TPR) repeat protein